MSDSFADLWNSTAPTKPTQPQTLRSASNSFGTTARSTLSSTPLGAGRGSTSGAGRKPYQSQDVFTLLSAASASGPGSARSSPVSYSSGHASARASSGPSSRSITPVINTNTAAGITSQSRSAVSASANKDAFSSLFSDSLGGNSAEQREDLRTMTMAERAEKHRLDSLKKHAPNITVGSGNDSNWAGLDMLARPSNISKNSRSASPAVGNAGSSVLDDFSFEPIRPSKLDSTASAYTTPTKLPEHNLDDDWGLGDFGTPSRHTKNATSSTPSLSLISQELPGRPSKQQQQSKSLWDLGDFDASASTGSVQTHDSALSFETQSDSSSRLPDDKRRRTDTRRPDSPSDDFDFGNREDALLGGMDSDDDRSFGHEHAGHGGDGDDILGMLSQPVDLIRRQQERGQDQRRDKQRQRQAGELGTRSASASSGGPLSANGRTPTPPPHILGKLVEMGFSIEQAKTALASTETGLDVEVALELLLAGVTEDAVPQLPKSRHREDSTRSSAPDLGSRERARERGRARQRDRDQDANPAMAPNIQEQADKLLAQASEIGMSVLSKASLFWKEGKEKVQKVYEERTGASLSGVGTSAGGGKRDRPKWMQDEVDDEEGVVASPQSAFRDDDHPNDKTRHGLQNNDQELRPSPAKVANFLDGDRRSAKENRTDAPQRAEPNLFGLDGDTMPQIYRSPFRRGKPDSGSSSPAPTQPTQPSPPRKPAPVHPLVQAPVASLTASTRHKAQGGAKFKLGQYGDAEVSYTKAIEGLPEGHLLLVPLLNNRALVRLKNGEYKGAAEDATRVVEIVTKVFGVSQAVDLGGVVVGSNGQVADGAISNGLDGDDGNIDIGDGYVKAIRRRAEALEGREKWTEASNDWEVIISLDWVKGNVKDVALRGIGRCRQMVNGASSVGGGSDGLNSSNVPSNPQPKRAPPPKPKPRPAPVASSTAESKALKALRSQTQAAESEDLQRHALKDSVDAKLSTWKSGKETNIRALLASLDLVLWSELGVQKVGMHELVSPAQVKSRYVRVIARLHPDKLNAGNTTVEQRMIANAVFGALNEAWNAFKQ